MRRLLLALLGGIALWLSWPTRDLWPLGPVGIAALAVATHGVGVRRGLGLGVVAGLAAFLPALHWSGIYVGALPWVALCVAESLYVGVTGALSGWLSGRRARVPYPVVVAAAWTVGEWLRSTTPFGGFPWLKIAFAQGTAPILPLVRYVGTPGLTFAVALVGGLLAQALLVLLGGRTRPARTRRTSRLPWRPGRRAGTRTTPSGETAGRPGGPTTPAAPSTTGTAVADQATGATVATQTHGGTRRARRVARAAGALAAAAAITWGPMLLHVPTAGRPVDVLAVQGDVPRAGLDFNAERRQVLDNHAAVTRRAVQGARTTPDLVVWPENASDIDPVANPDAGAVITSTSAAAHAPILVGTLRTDDKGKIRNTTLLWQGARGPIASYAKRHPVPFAEYIPYRGFFRHFSDKVDLLTHDFVPGDTVGAMDVPTRSGTVRVGLGICFEVAYDDIMRDAITHGAQVLAVQTNNATFGYTDESYQQLAISRVRAVETGRAIVHVSTVGTSALVTPDGVAHQQTSLFTPAALRAELPLRTEVTPAVRIGDLPVWLCWALLVVAALTRRRRLHD